MLDQILCVISGSTGSVDLRYKLGLITHKYELTRRNLADGFPHYINITRHNNTIKTQVGFSFFFTLAICCHFFQTVMDEFCN